MAEKSWRYPDISTGKVVWRHTEAHDDNDALLGFDGGVMMLQLKEITELLERLLEQAPPVSDNPLPKMLTQKDVMELLSYSPMMIWRLENAGNFPRRVKLSDTRDVWVKSEVEAWLRERMEARPND
jgi:prophage regulatory protein